MEIIIGSDFVPTNSNLTLFEQGSKQELFGDELTRILDQAAYRIFNLEVPLTDRADPIRKKGPSLIAPVRAIEGYRAAGADLLTLANNHIMDQGAKGLRSTLDALEQAGITYVGVGGSLKEAARPFIFSFGEKTIGVYACAEHEFSIASETQCGANPFDPLYSPDHVEELKSRTDYVIVLYHGGKEHYRYPSPRLQIVCRKLVEKGADLVVCQHSHCIGCEEKYHGSTIVYGQGNFLFDHNEREEWQTSLLISLDEMGSVRYIPLVKRGAGVRAAQGERKEEILESFRSRSEQIKEDGFIESAYARFAEEFLRKYLAACRGKESFLFRAFNTITRNKLRAKRLIDAYGADQRITIRNYIECEAHQELFLAGLQEKENKEDYS